MLTMYAVYDDHHLHDAQVAVSKRKVASDTAAVLKRVGGQWTLQARLCNRKRTITAKRQLR
jgi:hypothetical protein